MSTTYRADVNSEMASRKGLRKVGLWLETLLRPDESRHVRTIV